MLVLRVFDFCVVPSIYLLCLMSFKLSYAEYTSAVTKGGTIPQFTREVIRYLSVDPGVQ